MKILRQVNFSGKSDEDYEKRRNKRLAAAAGLAAGGTASAVLGTKVIPRKLEEKAIGDSFKYGLGKAFDFLKHGEFDTMDYIANREKYQEEAREVGKKIGDKLERNKKISKAAGLTGAGLAAGGLGYLAYKQYKDKKSRDNKGKK